MSCLNELLAYNKLSFEVLKAVLEKTSNEEWATVKEFKKLGMKSKAELLAHMVLHTAHRSRQISMILLHGK